MAEWTVIDGHILGQCAYLDSLNSSWEPGYSGCDCADLLEDDPVWGTDYDEDDDDH
jgi:hypothetical protein